jgi:hypothetical protein
LLPHDTKYRSETLDETRSFTVFRSGQVRDQLAMTTLTPQLPVGCALARAGIERVFLEILVSGLHQ